jgi:hypothetical protein
MRTCSRVDLSLGSSLVLYVDPSFDLFVALYADSSLDMSPDLSVDLCVDLCVDSSILC